MNHWGKMSLAVLTVGISGFGGWRLFQPKAEDQGLDRVYSGMAKTIDVDPGMWKQVGRVLDKATARSHQDLSSDEVALLYKALDTGKSGAQKPALMALQRCPPTDTTTFFQKVTKVATQSNDADVQNWAYTTLWVVTPERHAEIRQLASASQFPEIAEEVKRWPEQFPKKK